MPIGLPFAQFSVDEKWAVVEVDTRIRRSEIDVRRYLPVLEREDGFYKPGHTGGRIQMTHIRFHRADRTEAPIEGGFSKCPSQRSNFDRVTDQSTGSMSFDVRH